MGGFERDVRIGLDDDVLPGRDVHRSVGVHRDVRLRLVQLELQLPVTCGEEDPLLVVTVEHHHGVSVATAETLDDSEPGAVIELVSPAIGNRITPVVESEHAYRSPLSGPRPAATAKSDTCACSDS